jgi:hypothetical protein
MHLFNTLVIQYFRQILVKKKIFPSNYLTNTEWYDMELISNRCCIKLFYTQIKSKKNCIYYSFSCNNRLNNRVTHYIWMATQQTGNDTIQATKTFRHHIHITIYSLDLYPCNYTVCSHPPQSRVMLAIKLFLDWIKGVCKSKGTNQNETTVHN